MIIYFSIQATDKYSTAIYYSHNECSSCNNHYQKMKLIHVPRMIWLLGCTTKTPFSKIKKRPTRQASVWGLVWRNPKGFLISTMFRGSSSHFRFDHFYIVDFHSALTFLDRDLCSEGWVKICNVKMVKILMLSGFGLFYFWKKCFLVHPNVYSCWVICPLSPTFIYNFLNVIIYLMLT